MSRYLLNKFLFTIDRDPELVERYRTDPVGTVAWWEETLAGRALNLADIEPLGTARFTDDERDALVRHDHVALFGMGAHGFLALTLWIAMFERDDPEPLGMQRAYGRALSHIALPYPDITT